MLHCQPVIIESCDEIRSQGIPQFACASSENLRSALGALYLLTARTGISRQMGVPNFAEMTSSHDPADRVITKVVRAPPSDRFQSRWPWDLRE